MTNEAHVSLGQNLKNIRKELGLRQHEIVGDEITRNLISMIENDKTPLYYRTAKLIADNINRISEQRNLGVYIDPYDIMDPNRVVAKKQADEYIEKLRSYLRNKCYTIDEDYVKEIEDFLKEWNIPDKKVYIYEILGDISYYCKDYQAEYMYLTRGLENYFIKPIRKDIHLLVQKLIGNCITAEKYNESIRLNNLDFMSVEKIPHEFQGMLCYNMALTYKRLKRYDEALEWIEKTKKYVSERDPGTLRKALILEGTCYYRRKEADKAKAMYDEVIKMSEAEDEEIGLAYQNMMDIYKAENNEEQVIKYRDELMDIVPKIDASNRYLVKIYYKLAEICEYLHEYDQAEEWFMKAIKKSEENNERKDTSKVALLLLDFYNNSDNKDKIFTNKKVFEKCLNDISLSDEVKVLLKLILRNLENEKIEESKNLINQILEGGLINEN